MFIRIYKGSYDFKKNKIVRTLIFMPFLLKVALDGQTKNRCDNKNKKIIMIGQQGTYQLFRGRNP